MIICAYWFYAVGPGDLGAARPHHPGLLIEWDVGCGNVRAELMSSLELLETAAGDGRIRLAVARPVVGWYLFIYLFVS